MKKTLGTLALILVLALTACSGAKKPSSSRTSSPTSTTDMAAADEAKAAKLVLVQADFPAGWSASPPSPDPEGEAQDKKLAACVGAVDPDVSESAEVDGPDVSKDNATVSTTATYVKTTEFAQSDLAAITGPKLESCIKDFGGDALKSAFEESGASVTLKSIEIDPLTTQKYGDATVGRRIIATLAAEGQEIKVYFDLVFLLKGRAEVSAFFGNVGEPFDATLERDLLAKLAAKLAAA